MQAVKILSHFKEIPTTTTNEQKKRGGKGNKSYLSFQKDFSWKNQILSFKRSSYSKGNMSIKQEYVLKKEKQTSHKSYSSLLKWLSKHEAYPNSLMRLFRFVVWDQ